MSQTQSNHWLRLNLNPYTYISPEIGIISFDNNALYINEFDKLVVTIPLEDDEFYEKNPNKTKVTFHEKKKYMDVSFSGYTEDGDFDITTSSYIKLTPTNTSGLNEKEIEDITKSSFTGIFNHKTMTLKFNHEFVDDIPHLHNRKILGNSIRLEKYLDYYFVSFYVDQRRANIIPVYKIETDLITLYGRDETNSFFTLNKVSE